MNTSAPHGYTPEYDDTNEPTHYAGPSIAGDGYTIEPIWNPGRGYRAWITTEPHDTPLTIDQLRALADQLHAFADTHQ